MKQENSERGKYDADSSSDDRRRIICYVSESVGIAMPESIEGSTGVAEEVVKRVQMEDVHCSSRSLAFKRLFLLYCYVKQS